MLGRRLAIAEWRELLADEPDDEALEVHRGVAVDVVGRRVAATAAAAVRDEQELAVGNLASCPQLYSPVSSSLLAASDSILTPVRARLIPATT